MESLIVDLAMWHRAFTFGRENIVQVNFRPYKQHMSLGRACHKIRFHEG